MKRVYDDQFTDELATYGYQVQLTNGRRLSGILHSHTFFEFILVMAGGCVERVNGMTAHKKAGELTILSPGDEHVYLSQEPDTDLFVLSVRADEVGRFCLAYGETWKNRAGIARISAAARYDLLDSCKRLLLCDAGEKLLHYRLLLGRLIHALAEADKQGQANMPPSLSKALEKVRDFEYLAGGVSSLEALSGYSRPQLIRLMKKHLGATPMEYMNGLRMEAAYALVIHAGLSVEEIAEKVGYKSVSHFERVFRARYAVSPARLRSMTGRSI